MAHAEVGSVVLHMFAFGMTSTDEQGEAPVKKGTRLMSSSGEFLKRVDRKCSNGGGGTQHRHVHLIQGRAKAAQVYPRELADSLCEGIAAQKHIETLGITPRDIMSVETMRQAAKSGVGECPSEALHNNGFSGMEAFDDVTGQALRPELMIKARKDEIDYFRSLGVFEKVDAQECWSVTGKAPIGVRWVDINKGDSSNPNYREAGCQGVQYGGAHRTLRGNTAERVPADHAEQGRQWTQEGC